jgi:AcrR family transcriptional regulator
MATRAGAADKRSTVSRKTPLSQERIIAAALELADTRGDFSMRALGEQLGVDPMAIYRHFEDKDALLDALVDTALADLAPAGPEAGAPIERLRRLCLDFRQALSDHPGVAPRIRATLPTLGPHAIALTEAALGLIHEVGVEAGEAPRVFTLLIRFVTAAVEEEEHVLADSGTEQAWREAVRSRYAALSPDAFPHVAAMAADLAGSSYQDDFEYGLDLLLDAIARRRSGDLADS